MQTTQSTNSINSLSKPESTSIHPVILKVLTERGIGPDQLEDFFSWDLKKLPDLTALKDMEKATSRIAEAIENNEKVAIYGDYDVDGTTSCALFVRFFEMIGFEVLTYQPNRFTEGYGIHECIIDRAIEENVSLIISVDCGITNVAAADYSQEKNVDLIITDHHKDAAEKTPEAFAVINPNRRDENLDRDMKCLAGVGVAFAVCVAVRNELITRGKSCPSIYSLLQYVAIGTIADLVPLTPTNMKLVRHGLDQLKKSNYEGIRTFFTPEERQLDIIPSEKISFQIGPMINAKGRLEHPDAALRLLISNDSKQAFELHSQLVICNNERKFIQADVFEQAKNRTIENIQVTNNVATVVYQDDWHEGVIGIVASKLVENFGAPAIVFTNSGEEGIIKGSARTAGSVNIHEALSEFSQYFIKFGGHPSAAGLSMKVENFELFKAEFLEYMREIPSNLRTQLDSFDIMVESRDLTKGLAKSIELLEPFGNENGRPIFRTSDFRISSFDILKEKHVRWELIDLNGRRGPKGITFNYLDRWDSIHPTEIIKRQNNEKLMIDFKFNINRFNGNEYLQLQIDKINFS